MANEQNLTNTISSAEVAREMQLKSAESRKKNNEHKRDIAEIADEIASRIIEMPNPKGAKEEMSFAAAVVFKQFQKAIMEGDTAAARFVVDVLGGIKKTVSVEGGGITVVVRNEDDKKIIEGIKELDI